VRIAVGTQVAKRPPLDPYGSDYRRFADTLAGACARLGADAVRYSFIVADFHHLLLAGFTGAPAVLRASIIELAARHKLPGSTPIATSLRPAASLLTDLTSSSSTGKQLATWIEFSRERSQPIFRCSRLPSTSSLSTSKPRRRSVSPSRRDRVAWSECTNCCRPHCSCSRPQPCARGSGDAHGAARSL
jgi:hypothetical protein